MKPTDLLTDDQLAQTMPSLSAKRRALYLPLLIAAMKEFGIAVRAEICAFLAQLGHESVDLRYMQEIASGEEYEGRRDLGNIHAGDGRRYKGRGPIQLTGRGNYRRYGSMLGLPLEQEPELAASPEVGFRIAALYWRLNCQGTARNLTGKFDAYDLNLFKLITRQINGGYNGLPDRIQRYKRALRAIPVEAAAISASHDSPAPATSGVVATQGTPYTPSPGSTIAPPKSDAGQAIPSSSGDPSWIEEQVDILSPSDVRDGAKKASTGMKAFKAFRPLALLYAALEAGNIYAWLGVAVLVGGLGLLVYLHRHDIARIAVKLFRKAVRNDAE